MGRTASLALVLSLAIAVDAIPAHAERLLCITGGTVLDPEAASARIADIVVSGETIREIAPGAGARCPPGARVDATGRYVIPGLIDAHSHAFMNPSPTDRGAEDLGRVAFAKLVLQAGVMAVLDLGDRQRTLFSARDRLRGSREHARFLAAGFVFVGKGKDKLAGATSVASLAARKPALIKILYKGGDIAPVVAAAKARGLKTVVHIGSWGGAMRAVRAGASAITHFEDERVIPDELVAEMAKRGTISIPTMAVQCDLLRIVEDPAFLDDPLLARLTTPALRAEYRRVEAYRKGARYTLGWQKGCRANDMRSVAKLRKAGVTILAGPDTDNLGVFQGYSVHREMELLVEGGLSPWEALASASTKTAGFLGLPWGVRVGAPANLIVLGASPLVEIGNARRIQRVIYRGRRVR